MKKCVLVLLVMALFLVTTPLSAVGPELTNLTGMANCETLETKIITQEVAGIDLELILFQELAPPTEILGDLPFPGTEQGFNGNESLDFMITNYQELLPEAVISSSKKKYLYSYGTFTNYCGGDCFGGSIPELNINTLMAA